MFEKVPIFEFSFMFQYSMSLFRLWVCMSVNIPPVSCVCLYDDDGAAEKNKRKKLRKNLFTVVDPMVLCYWNLCCKKIQEMPNGLLTNGFLIRFIKCLIAFDLWTCDKSEKESFVIENYHLNGFFRVSTRHHINSGKVDKRKTKSKWILRENQMWMLYMGEKSPFENVCLCVFVNFSSFFPFSKITNQIHTKWVCLLPQKKKKFHKNEWNFSRLKFLGFKHWILWVFLLAFDLGG